MLVICVLGGPNRNHLEVESIDGAAVPSPYGPLALIDRRKRFIPLLWDLIHHIPCHRTTTTTTRIFVLRFGRSMCKGSARCKLPIMLVSDCAQGLVACITKVSQDVIDVAACVLWLTNGDASHLQF